MKRAFCEPGNVSVNPPLALARDLSLGFFGKLEVAPEEIEILSLFLFLSLYFSHRISFGAFTETRA